MPVRIFIVQGDKPIGALEAEISKWQESLGSKATVTHTSTLAAAEGWCRKSLEIKEALGKPGRAWL